MEISLENYPAISPEAEVAPGAKFKLRVRVCRGAVIGNEVSLGENNYIGPGVHISGEVVCGENLHVDDDVTILGPVEIGDDVWIAHGAVVGAEPAPGAIEPYKTTIGNRALIGKEAILCRGIRLGDYTYVRARTHLYGDLPSQGMVYGDPGVLQAFLCMCGSPITLRRKDKVVSYSRCSQCGKETSVANADMKKIGHILMTGGRAGAKLHLGYILHNFDYAANMG